mgnify:FL=1
MHNIVEKLRNFDDKQLVRNVMNSYNHSIFHSYSGIITDLFRDRWLFLKRHN